MELEGLKRGVNLLQQSGIQISELVTDRHPQVLKYVRENMQTTKRSVDVWHVSKGEFLKYADVLKILHSTFIILIF